MKGLKQRLLEYRKLMEDPRELSTDELQNLKRRMVTDLDVCRTANEDIYADQIADWIKEIDLTVARKEGLAAFEIID